MEAATAAEEGRDGIVQRKPAGWPPPLLTTRWMPRRAKMEWPYRYSVLIASCCYCMTHCKWQRKLSADGESPRRSSAKCDLMAPTPAQ